MLFTSTQLTFTLLFLCSPYFSMCSPTISDILQCPQLLPILLWSSLSSVNTEVSAWTSRENRSHQVKTPSPSSGSSDSPTALVPDCFGLNFLPQLLELTTSTFLDLSSCFPIHGSFFPPNNTSLDLYIHSNYDFIPSFLKLTIQSPVPLPRPFLYLL